MTAADSHRVPAGVPCTRIEVVSGRVAPDSPLWGRMDLAAIPVDQDESGNPQPPARSAGLAARYGVSLESVLTAEKVSGRAGELVRVPVLAPEGLPPKLVMVGTGASTPQDLRRAGAALARAARGRESVVSSIGDGASPEATRALVEGLVLGGYQPPARGRRDRRDSHPAGSVTLLGRRPTSAVDQGLVHAAATVLARDLAATPSNIKDPAWLAGQAVAIAAEAGLRVEVWDAARLAEERFGGLLHVGEGSASPPCLVRLEYLPTEVRSGDGSEDMRPVVLVGKGITFDSGGLSLKPREAMVPMKTDMSGAAAVLAVLAACSAAAVRRRVIGLLPLAENAFGGSSYRPGDVLRQAGGRTVEVINTDAEGRLVLADALAHAVASLDPAVLVDVATLTGAATLGLGRRHAALYATDDDLAQALGLAGEEGGERTWRMPLVEDYREVLDSEIADLRHVSADARVGGGSITAALFLREFTGGVPWAHLDIAGPARSEKDEYEVCRGATGFGARLLLRWLESLD